eukprot:s3348_g2.t1
MDEDLPLPSWPAASQHLTPCTGIMQGSSAPSASARGVGTAQVAQAVADSDIDRLLFTARVQGLPDSLPRLPWESGVMAAIFGDSFLPKPLVVLFTARVQGLPDSLPRLPWESGVMAAIFGDSFLPKPLVVQPGAPAESTTSVDDDPNLSAASRVRPAPCTLYEQSFASRADVPVQEEDAHLWAKAVGKWCTIFLLAHSDPGQVGVQAAQCLAAEGEAARDELLRDVFGLKSPRTAIKRANALLEGEAARDELLRDVFGLKSPRTAIKRANALLRCFRWHQREHDFVWPWDSTSVTAFVKSLGDSVSAVSGLFEAINFAHHVMGLPFHADILADRRLQGRAKRLAGEKPEATQQTPLTVEAVAKLEKLAGWVAAWFDAGRQLGVVWDDEPFGPLVRAPNSSGHLCARRCSSSEAGAMLCNALNLEGHERRTSHVLKGTTLAWVGKRGFSERDGLLLGHHAPGGHERRTSHVLKGTTLAWVGKRGFSERDGLLLGHHAPGSSSLACYSRELLSAPLRAYRAMLREIRSNTFKPDTTRSGWLAGCDNLGLPKTSAPLRAYRAMLREIRSNTFKPDTTRSGWLAGCDNLGLPKTGGFASADVGSAEALSAAVGLSTAGGAGLLVTLEPRTSWSTTEPTMFLSQLSLRAIWARWGPGTRLTFAAMGPAWMNRSPPPDDLTPVLRSMWRLTSPIRLPQTALLPHRVRVPRGPARPKNKLLLTAGLTSRLRLTSHVGNM